MTENEQARIRLDDDVIVWPSGNKWSRRFDHFGNTDYDALLDLVRRQDEQWLTMQAADAVSAVDAGQQVQWLRGSWWESLNTYGPLLDEWRDKSYAVVARIVEPAPKKVPARDLLTMHPLPKKVNGCVNWERHSIEDSAGTVLAVCVPNLEGGNPWLAPDALVEVER